MELLMTCNLGVESLIKKEISNLGYKITQVKDRLVFFEGTQQAIARVNLWSRFGNKVYMKLASGKTRTFEDLFQLIQGIDWKNLVESGQPILVEAVSIKSILSSVPAIQSISKKSIVKKLLGGDDGLWPENNNEYGIEILIVIDGDSCDVLLNTTGNSLHQRGYRVLNVQAPLKENLAAAIVSISNRKYSLPFYDFFCGGGTLPIEAALIAKNIAPGMTRSFDFEHFKWFDQTILPQIKNEAMSQIYLDKTHQIVGYDIDPRNIEIANANARKAGVEKYVRFEQKSFDDVDLKSLKNIHIVSNPPYGLRLDDPDLSAMYLKIRKLFELGENIFGGIITANEDFRKMINHSLRKDRKLYNGGEKCYFYKFMG